MTLYDDPSTREKTEAERDHDRGITLAKLYPGCKLDSMGRILKRCVDRESFEVRHDGEDTDTGTRVD